MERMTLFSGAFEDKIPGGLGDDRPDSDFDPEQLRMGIKVEKEHTIDAAKAKEIAKDHLSEDPRYYTKLKKIEPQHEAREVNPDGTISAGIFLPIPYNLARQFPNKDAHDDSVPHYTLLYVGDISPEDFYDKLVPAVRDVAQRFMPFSLEMRLYGEFKNDKGQSIAHMGGFATVPKVIPQVGRPTVHLVDMGHLHAMLWGAAEARDVNVAHGYKGTPTTPDPVLRAMAYKSHATLQYMEPGEVYSGPKPAGQWKVTELEVWGHEKIRVPLGDHSTDQPHGQQTHKNGAASQERAWAEALDRTPLMVDHHQES